jgi:hypothetical protein
VLRVTVEIVPNGEESLKKELAHFEISNTMDHPDRPLWGRYDVRVESQGAADKFKIYDFYRHGGWSALVSRVFAVAKERQIV